jgi:hypothetical protein
MPQSLKVVSGKWLVISNRRLKLPNKNYNVSVRVDKVVDLTNSEWNIRPRDLGAAARRCYPSVIQSVSQGLFWG